MTSKVRDRELFRAWLLVHHLERRWLAMLIGSWATLLLFASVTVPLKYPYEAREQVVDSGVVIGLLVPLAVMNLALEEGPDDLLRTSARSLSAVRIILATGYLAFVAATAVAMAWAVALPFELMLTDALALAALSVVGTSLLGVRLGWILPGVVAFTMSAPGLVPLDVNALYNRDVSSVFVVGVLVASAAAVSIYARRGSTAVRRACASRPGRMRTANRQPHGP